MSKPLLETPQGEFVQVYYPGRNTSGIVPYGKNVLIKMDEFAPVSSGGIIRIETRVDEMSAASETGCIFALGPHAFARHDDGSLWNGAKPEVGDRVFVGRYSGVPTKGADGGMYRIMGADCVYGGMDPDYAGEGSEPN